ncbi:MAG: UTP--glucose-1-phosphate uridylyltransferase GalU [Dictyoglomus sp.]|nr:UTP--glucose-1-phosphate uridylyltransferase GalU [Dictyoglomus sp.]MCX7941517.1 UTP--glucose-1-phosphate uridylyltransferase GalU [Dictyoglomaceae bacterium]MDW8187863.1 UTP--glucose-1-phosphate uridylyltransferase GalU [Dictyoglomus sp.]
MGIRKAVFPAAGLGTRFLPATKAQPKEMLPVVDKPIIQYGVEEAVNSGLEEIVIVTGRNKRAIEDHFDISFELEYFLQKKGELELLKQVRRISELATVYYIRQKEPLGLGHAILVTKEIVKDEPFAVVLSDDLIVSDVPCLKQMISIYERYKCSVIAVERVAEEEVKNYGIIAGKELENGLYQITDLIEKPSLEEAPSNLAIVGRYILTPEIFNMLEKVKPGRGGEIQLTDGLKLLLEREAIYAYEFKGKRYDTGNKLGFLIASVELALKREDIGKIFKEYLKNLNLEEFS